MFTTGIRSVSMHTPNVAPPTGAQLHELKPKHAGAPLAGIAEADGIHTLVRNLDGVAAMAGRAKELHAQLEPIERLGQLLHDNSESARKFGSGISEFFGSLIADAPESFGALRAATNAAAGAAAPRMRLRRHRAAHRPIVATKLGRRHD
jgi:hypothetical protein